jgi:lysophospholipase L1-like esterase
MANENVFKPYKRTGQTCALLGDSFLARSYNVTYPNQENSWGIYGWINNYLNRAFTLVYNGGVSGDKTSDILLRVPNVIASSAAWCIVDGGINDSSAGTPVATIVANLKSICDQLVAAGISVIYLSCGPNSGQYSNVQNINEQMQEYILGSNTSLYYADTFSATVNPTDSTGAWAAGMSDDGTHPSAKGARVYGQVLSSMLSKFLAPGIKLVNTVVNSYVLDSTQKQVLTNPLMTGTTGTITGTGASGTAATGWTGGTAGGTLTSTWLAGVTRSDGIGFDQQVTVAAGAGSASSISLRQQGIQSRFAIGDTVYSSMALTATGMVGVQAIYMQMQYAIDGTTYYAWSCYQTTATVFDQSDLTINLQSPDTKLTGTALTTVNFSIAVLFDTTGTGAGVFKFGRVGLFKK